MISPQSTAAAPAPAAPAAPKPNAWNTKAPVFVPSSALLASLPQPISHLNKPVIVMAPVAPAPPAVPAAIVAPEVKVETKVAAAPEVKTTPVVNENLGINGPVDTIPTNVAMPTAGVWLRTTLYEPKGTLGPVEEQELNVVWVQAQSGHYIDIRVPPVVKEVVPAAPEGSASPAAARPHNRRAVKSFAGVASFDHATARQEWVRRIDYRAVPAKDVGHIRLVDGGKQMVEDGVLAGDDYREVWTKQLQQASEAKKTKESAAVAAEGNNSSASSETDAAPAAPAAPKKLWASIVAPAATPAPTPAAATATEAKKSTSTDAAAASGEVVAVLTHRRAAAAALAKAAADSAAAPAVTEEVVGYFLQVSGGYYALTLNLRSLDLRDLGLAGPSGRRPTEAELRSYFSGATATAAVSEKAADAAPAAKTEDVKPAAAGFSYASMAKKIAAAGSTAATAATAPTAAAAANTANAPLTEAQIEDFLSRYVTIVGHSGNWSIQYALQSSMCGRSLSGAVFTHSSTASGVKLFDILRKLHVRVVTGKLPKFLSTVLKDAYAPQTTASAGKETEKSGRGGNRNSSGKEDGSRRNGDRNGSNNNNNNNRSDRTSDKKGGRDQKREGDRRSRNTEQQQQGKSS